MIRTDNTLDSCYLCTTPLQVLGAISLQLAQSEKADLYLFDDFDRYQEIGERIREIGIFNNVYCLDFYSTLKAKNKNTARAKIFIRMLFCNRYLRRFVGRELSYEKLYCSTSAVSKMVVANALFNRNTEMQVIRFDEGIGSYSNNDRGRKGSPLYQQAKKILHWRNLIDEAEQIYLYKPELMMDNQISVNQMPRIELNAENRTLLSEIFFGSLDETIAFKERILIFDTYRDTNRSEELAANLDELYQIIMDLNGHRNVLLKSHPRSKIETGVNIPKFRYKALPIEMVYMQQEDLESKILIALNSTAVFTPKMLFNVEPRIILLYRLVSNDQCVRKKRDDIYLNMARMYKTSDKILIPNTIEEMEDILKKWMNDNSSDSDGSAKQ